MSSEETTLNENVFVGPVMESELVPTQTNQKLVPEKIEIGTIDTFFGVATILIAAGMAWGSLKNSVSSLKNSTKEVKNSLNNKIRPDLQDVRERFAIVEDRVDTTWKNMFAPSTSPRQLNKTGKYVLENSGIKEIIEEKKDVLLNKIKKKNLNTAYDAEIAIHSTVDNLLEYFPDMTNDIKEGAFNVGQNIDVLLFVGGIYLRNLIFEDLGFSIEELDRKKT